jgi:hypothetical protein
MRGCAGWFESMLVANPLCWLCRAAAHLKKDCRIKHCKCAHLAHAFNEKIINNLKKNTFHQVPVLLVLTIVMFDVRKLLFGIIL